jgi:hypothetical protein
MSITFSRLKHILSAASAITGVLLITTATPAYAQDRFDNGVIQFDVDTVVEFEFLESRGVYQSTFGVVDLRTRQRIPLIQEVQPADRPIADLTVAEYDDALGSPGNAVPQPSNEFEFKANTPYALYLESYYAGRPAGIFYSTDAQNPEGERRLRLDGSVADMGNGGVVLRWDDTGSLLVAEPLQDDDFNDFTVRAGGHLVCPWDNQR